MRKRLPVWVTILLMALIVSASACASATPTPMTANDVDNYVAQARGK